MGIFRGIVDRSQITGYSDREPSDKLLTPSNLLTASRPILAAKAAGMLLCGERGVGKVVAVMAATDMEGMPARVIDSKWPESGLGTSKIGADADIIADSLAVLMVSGAALHAPRVSRLGKSAVAIMLGTEGVKTAWALSKSYDYKKLTGERLRIPTSLEGKEAMLEKLVALEGAVLTGDTDNRLLRNSLGISAVALAVSGSIRGERARSDYMEVYDEMIADYALSLPEAQISAEPINWPHPMQGRHYRFEK